MTFRVSVLLLMINWVITLSKWLWNHESKASGTTGNFENVMKQFFITRRQAHKKNWRQFFLYNKKTQKWSNETSFQESLFSASLVVGRKTLVVVVHVTTQNLSDKKICWVGWVAEYFVCCCDKPCCKPRSIAKDYLFYRGLKSNFADEECDAISAVFKI